MQTGGNSLMMRTMSLHSLSEIRIQRNFPAVFQTSPPSLISHPPPAISEPCSLPSSSLLLPPSLPFIQFNFELCTGRQAERVAPWLPGTRPSHYTANWFWPAAMSAAYLPPRPAPSTMHHPPSSISAPQTVCSKRRFQNTQEGKRLRSA